MKQVVNLFLLSILFLSACNKNKEDIVIPKPSDPSVPTQESPFVLELTLDREVNQDSLEVLVSIDNAAGASLYQQEVIKIGRKASSPLQWVSAERKLPKGQYRLTQVLVKQGETAISAAPVVASRKAKEVSYTLPLLMNLNGAPQVVQPKTLTIGEVDGPADFGYPSGFFPQQGILVNVKMKIKVGKIMYDMPVSTFNLLSTDASGQRTSSVVERSAENTFRISKNAVEQEINLKHWNLSLSKTLKKADLVDNMEIVLEGEKEARRLSRTESFLEVQGQWMPKAKALYEYRGDGLLQSAVYYQKKPEVYELVHTLTDKAVYAGNRLMETVRTNGENKKVGSTKFEYSADDVISHVIQTTQAGTTYSVIEQTASTEGTVADVYMVLDNGATVHYSHTFSGGNKIKYAASTSGGKSEGGEYSYDQMINPYAHTMFPDMNLTHVSKNNILHSTKGFSGAFPSVVLYKSEYVYNEEGYPVELLEYYKSYATQEHLYRNKTVFYY